MNKKDQKEFSEKEAKRQALIEARKKARKEALEKLEFVYVNVDHVYSRRSDKETGEMLEGGFVLAWGAKGIGFGQIAFHQDGEDLKKLKITCSSECMGLDFVKKALLHLANTVELTD